MNHRELDESVARLEAEVTRLREQRIAHVDRTSRRRDRRLGGALTFAAILVLGLAGLGSASALPGSATVFTDDLVDNAVTSAKIADSTIAGTDLKDETIGGTDVKDGTITGADVRDTSIGAADLTDGSIRGADVADGTITGADLNLFNDNQCTGETVQGTAAVDADPAVPTTYTTNWLSLTHSCTGQPVQVRRESEGVYYVRFRGPMQLAMVTSIESHSTLLDVTVLGPGEFRIEVTYYSGFGALRADTDFSILAY